MKGKLFTRLYEIINYYVKILGKKEKFKIEVLPSITLHFW
jgi:hypothetical protein